MDIKLIPATKNHKIINLNPQNSVSFTVDIVDNTKNKINEKGSKTRNARNQNNISTKINSKTVTKNYSRVKFFFNLKDTLYKSNSSLIKF